MNPNELKPGEQLIMLGSVLLPAGTLVTFVAVCGNPEWIIVQRGRYPHTAVRVENVARYERRCPKCGTNGDHYCPADVATDTNN